MRRKRRRKEQLYKERLRAKIVRQENEKKEAKMKVTSFVTSKLFSAGSQHCRNYWMLSLNYQSFQTILFALFVLISYMSHFKLSRAGIYSVNLV